MTEQALKWLDFDDLVSVSDEAELKFKELSETEETLDMAKKPLRTLLVKKFGKMLILVICLMSKYFSTN